MLTQPDINEADIIACLLSFYHLNVIKLSFMPIGADFATAVYRAETAEGHSCFVKLRTDNFQENSIRLLDFFHQHHIPHIIPPLRTAYGTTWAEKEDYMITVFPYVSGLDGVEQPLSTEQFAELGRTVQRIHQLSLPPALHQAMKQEHYPTTYTDQLLEMRTQLDQQPDDGLAGELVQFLRKNEKGLQQLLTRTKKLRRLVQVEPANLVICHADMHGYNLLLDNHGDFFIIDWDETILAPKERDLMFIGSAIGGDASGTPDQQAAFYGAYQPDKVSIEKIAYYRYARIVEDIAIYCNEILTKTTNKLDLQQSFTSLKSNFDLNGTIAKADEAFDQNCF